MQNKKPKTPNFDVLKLSTRKKDILAFKYNTSQQHIYLRNHTGCSHCNHTEITEKLLEGLFVLK